MCCWFAIRSLLRWALSHSLSRCLANFSCCARRLGIRKKNENNQTLHSFGRGESVTGIAFVSRRGDRVVRWCHFISVSQRCWAVALLLLLLSFCTALHLLLAQLAARNFHCDAGGGGRCRAVVSSDPSRGQDTLERKHHLEGSQKGHTARRDILQRAKLCKTGGHSEKFPDKTPPPSHFDATVLAITKNLRNVGGWNKGTEQNKTRTVRHPLCNLADAFDCSMR